MSKQQTLPFVPEGDIASELEKLGVTRIPEPDAPDPDDILWIDRQHLAAEIERGADLATRRWARGISILMAAIQAQAVEKDRAWGAFNKAQQRSAEKDVRIAKLEAQVADLNAKLGEARGTILAAQAFFNAKA